MRFQFGKAPSPFTWPQTCQSWWRWWLHPWLPDHRPAPPKGKKKPQTGPKDRQAHFVCPPHPINLVSPTSDWEDSKGKGQILWPPPAWPPAFSVLQPCRCSENLLCQTLLPPRVRMLTARQTPRTWKYFEEAWVGFPYMVIVGRQGS